MTIYELIILLGVIETTKADHQFLLNLCFPRSVNFETREVAIDRLQRKRTMAPFVSPLVSGVAQKQDGFTTEKLAPAYLKPKDIVDPERILTRLAGEGITGTMSNDERRMAIIADILLQQRNQINRRLEWMAAEVLRTGAITIEGDNYPAQSLDFNRDAGNTVTLAGTARWSETATATPVDDIEDWSALLHAPATHIVMGANAWKHLRKNDEFKSLMETRRGSDSRAEFAPSNGAEVQWKAEVGDVQYWTYTGTYEDESGNEQLFIPTNEVLVLAPASYMGTRAHGAILSPSAGYQSLELFPRHFITQDPELEYIETQTAPLLVPGIANSSLRAVVAS